MSIQTELTRITNAKAAIKTAIEGKGVTVPDGTLLDGMASLIESIEAGGGGSAGIASGTVTYAKDASLGSCPNNTLHHNCGFTPTHMMWFISSFSDEASTKYTFPIGGIFGLYTDSAKTFRVSNWTYSKSTTDLSVYFLNKTISNFYFAGTPASETIQLSIDNSNYSTVAAGTTITWFLW